MKRDFGATSIIILVVFTILTIYTLYWIFLYTGYPIATDETGALTGIRSGAFGDAFGTLNALFSGMAFSGVIITLLLQRKDIKDNQKEVTRQRGEVIRQQEESQFYRLLSLQQRAVREFDLHKPRFGPLGNTTSSTVAKGRDCFKTWTQQLTDSYNITDSPDHAKRIQATYDKLWSNHRGDLSLYFRSLYNLFKFISSSEHVNKRWLGNVVRSLISDYELVILFYNCLSPKGGKFKAFANEFAIFDNLDPALLLDPTHSLLLERTAYGKNDEILKLFPIGQPQA